MSNEEQPIRDVVRQLETSWNAGDSATWASAFATDAEFIDVFGRHHCGRPVIEAGHRQIFDTVFRGSRNNYTVEKIRLIKPDVAIAFVHARLLSRAGSAVDDPQRSVRAAQTQSISEAEARPTLILVKNGEKWEIVSFQNTKIAESVTAASL